MRGERATWGAREAFERHSSAGLLLLCRLPGLRRFPAASRYERSVSVSVPSEFRLRIADGRFTKFIRHPALALLGVSVCVAFAVRALFFTISDWLWAFASKTDLNDVV